MLSLLPFVSSLPGATYQFSYHGTVYEGQYDAAGFFYAVPALVLVLYGLFKVCRGEVRGPRTVHAALLIAVGEVALFQLARTFGYV